MVFFNRLLIISGVFCFVINTQAQQKDVAITSDSVVNSFCNQSSMSLNDSIINYGKLFLKTPYRYGSVGTASFDCSGFTSYVFRNFGYNLERSSAAQAKQLPTVKREELKTGDLVFFEGRRRNGNVGHVGIVVARTDTGHFDFIHAAVHNGVTISNSSEAYYQKRFIRAGRIIDSKDTTGRIKGISPDFTPNQIAEAQTVKSEKIFIPAKYHKVRKGENLSVIADKYGLTVNALKQKNNLKKSNIHINQRLKIKDAQTLSKPETVYAKNTLNQVKNPDVVLSETVSTVDTAQTASTHTVKKGETLKSIAKAYNISVADIKKINKLHDSKIRTGTELKLAENTELSISENNTNLIETETAPYETVKPLTHEVKNGESLFTISKKYKVSVDEIKKINQLTDNKIVKGQQLLINNPNSTVNSPTEIAQNNTQTEKIEKTKEKSENHKVKKGESLYTIAKEHNITVDQLKQMNTLANNNIQPGEELVVGYKNSNKNTNEKITKIHKVKSGESLYSIAQNYGCTVAELKNINKRTENKLNIGEQLKVNLKN